MPYAPAPRPSVDKPCNNLGYSAQGAIVALPARGLTPEL
jgi:hypothetical protein